MMRWWTRYSKTKTKKKRKVLLRGGEKKAMTKTRILTIQ